MRAGSNRSYVLPAKQTVAVNGYKSAVPDIRFICASHLISKTTQYFIDYEKARRRYVPLGTAVLPDANNKILHVHCPEPGVIVEPVHERRRLDMVTLPTIFADIG